MPIQRRFLDWNRRGLQAAADLLLERCHGDATIDLQQVVVVFPGGRAGRRLLEILYQRAEQQSRQLIPPTLSTVGSLPELLHQPPRPRASAFARDLAWMRSLEGAAPSDLAVVLPERPAGDDTLGWATLAGTLSSLHSELSGVGLTFADVALRCEARSDVSESKRWQALARIQRAYLDDLSRADLADPYCARMEAVAQGACNADRDIVLVGVAEANEVLKSMLAQVAERVTALVLAPRALADRFDDFGCIKHGAWLAAAIEVPDSRLDLVDTPADQAEAVMRTLIAYQGRYTSDEVAIGVPDAEVVPYLQQQFSLHGLESRAASGVPLARSAPFSLLAATAEFLEHGRFTDFAALVRHPDLEDHLRTNATEPSLKGGDWLTRLDRYASEHLTTRVTASWLGDEARRAPLEHLHAVVESLLSGLRGPAQPAREWAPAVLGLLAAVYGHLSARGGPPVERARVRSCTAVMDVVREHQALDPGFSRVVPGHGALRLLLRQLEGAAIPAPAGDDAIELLGWLELTLDDAPALIVTGMNEGRVPASPVADPWLPEPLRRQLGLLDHDRRYARDAYALSVILASRPDVKFIAGRRSQQSDPLAPSRLLLAGAIDVVARRLLEFYEPGLRVPVAPLALSLSPGRSVSDFSRPRPAPMAAPMQTLSATALGAYVACPFHFYLQHVLKLSAVEDGSRELEGNTFGSLAHAVLQAFGADERSASLDELALRELLMTLLEREVAARFGAHPRPAVHVQVEVLRERLVAFAGWQARWAAQGWRIARTEAEPEPGTALFEVDGVAVELRGRIDRIDHHPVSGEWMVFDYKSGDRPTTPEARHRDKGGQWVDFQLPMYAHIVRALGIDGPLRFGYITLPRELDQVGQHIAEWSGEDLAAADEAAREVVRAIRAERFWPPAPKPPPFSEAYAELCVGA